MLALKGVIAINIEVDYETMFGNGNADVIHAFTGASTIEDMVKIHMNKLSEELGNVLNNKPLLRYNLDGKLIQNNPVEPKEEATPIVEEALPELEKVQVDDLPFNEGAEGFVDAEFVEIDKGDSGQDAHLVSVLDADINHVSMQLGIPQKIKISQLMSDRIIAIHGEENSRGENVTSYRGFPVEIEGMEESYIITYKAYDSSEIKLFTGK